MKVLAIECSSAPVSAAVICDGEVLGYAFSNVKITHSQTLFPIIESAIKSARLSISDIDTICVATGPGSFTGIRIGISSAKGLAEPNNLKCIGVSTLSAAAYMFLGENAIVCPVEDARCGQVYNALFRVNGNSVERLCDDRAIMIDQLVSELKSLKDNRIILCCDAAENVIEHLSDIKNILLAPKPLLFQNAVGVGLCASYGEKEFTDAMSLAPVYLKLPQAQRELNEKLRKDCSV